LKRSCENSLKSLISKDLGGNPGFLWITLLKTCLEWLQSLVHQGFCWIARQKSKFENLYESTTCARYGFGSGCGPDRVLLPHRITNFVHKWAGQKLFFYV
jgi:hypothetical protein